MKSKKILIISIIVAVLVITCIIGGVVYYQIIQKKQKDDTEYKVAVKKYERIVYVAKEVNSKIDSKIAETNEFIATNPDVRRRQNYNTKFDEYC